ncbi:pilus assembly protein CpaF [Fontibacillus solani]|uniref:Pilus assembly protein CpaF n=1 Tax=Fontibacillus solani TaxID=1572857 RepID=A0A7W3SUM7_9BACL|nr:ATPase, T2SS/T4P/T4SS family [Fontibacillus solani]MBA9086497.1 pilus assembly protein CpaF [Fontibacillus solani]
MKTIAFGNLAGGNATSGVLRLLQHLPKNTKAAVVELPCLGIPKLSYALQDNDLLKLSKERTIDQLILDFDRKNLQDLQSYIYTSGNADYFLINPKSVPEAPVVRKLSSNQSLIDLPMMLKERLQGYDYLFLVTQGTLIHPATHFALRTADAAVLYATEAVDFVGNYTHYRKLEQIFGVDSSRLFLFVTDNNVKISEAKVYHRYSELLKEWERLEPLPLPNVRRTEVENSGMIGMIEPLEYLDYQPQLSAATGMSESDTKKLEELTAIVRGILQESHMDEYIQSLTNGQTRQKIKYYISDIIRELPDSSVGNMGISDVIKWIQTEITELGVIQKILDDPDISSIEINGPDKVIVEVDGIDEHRKEIKFQSMDHLYQTIDKMLTPIGKPISSTDPIIDANYRGFRVCVVADNKHGYAGVSANAPLISIRKFPPGVYSDEACIKYGNVSREIIEFEDFIIPNGASVVVAGGTNSGKTAHLIRLPLRVPEITRIVTIEDSEEAMLASKIQYQNYPNLPSLLVKKVEDKNKSYDIKKLVIASLRLKPRIFLIGEIRDEEAAKEAISAANTGHVFWTSLHSNGAAEAATRLVQLNGNTSAAASQVVGAVDIIIFQKKLKNGRRVVTEISELIGYIGTEQPILNPLFKYDTRSKQHIKVGKITKPSLIEKILLNEPEEADLLRWCKID